MLIKIQDVIDDRLCYDKVRELRWSEGVKCPHCGSLSYRRQGHHPACEYRYRYQCKACQRGYDDLTNTVFQYHDQPLKTWIACLYLLRIDLPASQIAQELGLHEDDCRVMLQKLQTGAYERQPLPKETRHKEYYFLETHSEKSRQGS